MRCFSDKVKVVTRNLSVVSGFSNVHICYPVSSDSDRAALQKFRPRDFCTDPRSCELPCRAVVFDPFTCHLTHHGMQTLAVQAGADRFCGSILCPSGLAWDDYQVWRVDDLYFTTIQGKLLVTEFNRQFDLPAYRIGELADLVVTKKSMVGGVLFSYKQTQSKLFFSFEAFRGDWNLETVTVPTTNIRVEIPKFGKGPRDCVFLDRSLISVLMRNMPERRSFEYRKFSFSDIFDLVEKIVTRYYTDMLPLMSADSFFNDMPFKTAVCCGLAISLTKQELNQNFPNFDLQNLSQQIGDVWKSIFGDETQEALLASMRFIDPGWIPIPRIQITEPEPVVDHCPDWFQSEFDFDVEDRIDSSETLNVPDDGRSFEEADITGSPKFDYESFFDDFDNPENLSTNEVPRCEHVSEPESEIPNKQPTFHSHLEKTKFESFFHQQVVHFSPFDQFKGEHSPSKFKIG